MNEELFSPREQVVLKTLGFRKMSITDLSKKIDADNNVVAGSVRRINRKCKHHKLPWFLNGFGGGRAGRTIWKDTQS